MENKKRIRWDTILLIIGVVCLAVFGIISYKNAMEEKRSKDTMDQVRSMREVGIAQKVGSTEQNTKSTVTTSYDKLFETNEDMIGWLNISDTQIDYPVMQTPEDEEYYLHRDFFGEKDKNGCLLMDTDSDINRKGANLIIHGHNMRSGAMFGTLEEYKDSEYGTAHNLLNLYTREENREYQLIAVFYSKVYSSNEHVFKFYQYFGASNEEEFNNFYNNIKQMSLYDTGVEAQYGDEFLTLSTCAYHTKNGRFVVVAKRIK